jgi:hypothetical protein
VCRFYIGGRWFGGLNQLTGPFNGIFCLNQTVSKCGIGRFQTASSSAVLIFEKGFGGLLNNLDHRFHLTA